MILQEGGLLTTLTAAVVAQMDQSSLQNALYTGSDSTSNSAKFVVCVCNVGDSLAYVYSPKHGVREITHGKRDVLYPIEYRFVIPVQLSHLYRIARCQFDARHA